jgi:acetolactate synthase-1/2/3 large subunit
VNLKKEEIKEVIQNELHPQTDIMTMGEVINVLNELTGGDASLQRTSVNTKW